MRYIYRKTFLPEKLRLPPVMVVIIPILISALVALFLSRSYDPGVKLFTPKFQRQLIGPWEYQGQINSAKMTASLGKTKDEAQIKVEREGSSIEFDLPMQNATLKHTIKTEANRSSFVTPRTKNLATVENSYLIYEVPEKNIVTRYQMIDKGLKEEIILYKIPGANTFQSRIKLENLVMKMTSEGIPVFYDKQGRYQFHFTRPFVKDAKGKVSYGVKYKLTSYRGEPISLTIKPTPPPFAKGGAGPKQLLGASNITSEVENNYLLTIEVDPQWLHDPSRALPIIIDPTVVHDTQSEFAAGSLDRVKDVGAGETAPSLESYYHELPTDNYTVGLWHMENDWNDSSGNGNNGTAAAAATFTTTSRIGSYAGDFDGAVGTNVSVPSVFNLSNTNVTIEAWVNLDSTSENGAFVKIGGTNGYGIGVGLSYFNGSLGNNLVMLYENVRWISTGAPIGTGWHHVVMIIDNSGVPEGFIDGRSIGRYPGTNAGSPSGSSYIGGYTVSGNDRFADCFIDEVHISNIARTPEEIKLDAQRGPYAVYTSDVIDLGYEVNNWDSLSWTESGVATGDGETLNAGSTANLVAQWNLNATSGTAANNDAEGTSCGGTPANCDGTLTNFADTSGQDVGTTSGWTSNNRRWGTGALMMNGVTDYVNVLNTASLNFGTSSFSIESWINANDTGLQKIIVAKKPGTGTDQGYTLHFSPKQIRCRISDGTNIAEQISGKEYADGNWHYVACVVNRSTQIITLYIDGVAQGSGISTSAVGSVSTTQDFKIGNNGNLAGELSGIIDSVRVYGRALSASEILANYNAGNIEFQTRVGNSADPNDGTWEAWKPTTSETQIDSMDNPYLYNITDSGLVSYWPMNETTGVGTTVMDVKGTSPGSPTGTVLVDGKHGKARYFDGSSNISAPGNTSPINTLNTFSIGLWIKTTESRSSVLDYQQPGIIWKDTSGVGTNDWNLTISGGYIKWHHGNGVGGVQTLSSNITVNDGNWHYIVVTRNQSTGLKEIYIDGVLDNSATQTTNDISNNAGITIGSTQLKINNTIIDEIEIFNSVLSSTTISDYWRKGLAWPETVHPSTDTIVKAEGMASERINIGTPAIDINTVALWHLEETGTGTGSTAYDASENNNHGVATGTSLTGGVSGKARNFNGSSDYINLGTNLNSITALPVTIEAWIKVDSQSGTPMIVQQNENATNYYGFRFGLVGTYQLDLSYGSGGVIGAGSRRSYTTPVNTLTTNQWYHVAGVIRGATDMSIYVNGMDIGGSYSGSGGAMSVSGNGSIGRGVFASTYYFDGIIDEVRVSNVARSAEEIAEAYRAGRDHRLTRTISSTDLSSKTKLPFYVASDRQGTFLEVGVGESAYANYEPDSNTKGLWHLEEGAGIGGTGPPTSNWFLDSSGNNNHGTAAGTTPVQGKIGKARSFNGSNNYISTGNITIDDPFTIEAWVNSDLTNQGSYKRIVENSNATSFYLGTDTTGTKYKFIVNNNTSPYGTAEGGTISQNSWQYIVGVFSGTTGRLYVNGAEVANSTFTAPSSVSIPVYIGKYSGGASNLWTGIIDEVRVSNTVRTADEIRQAYEFGKRTHLITIDFKANLGAGGTILNSSTYSFTVDETSYGSSSMTNHLFEGDKIIVKEKVGSTEYIAQGTVTSVNSSTGAVTVNAWDTDSTFPAGGYTVNATVFKWQKEWFDITGSLSTQRNAVTNLTLRIVDTAQGANVWLDDFRYGGSYLTNYVGSSVASSPGYRYFQYRTIFSSSDAAVSASLTSATLDYSFLNTPGNCRLEESRLDNQIIINWTDNNTEETGYEIQKNTDDAGFSDLYTAAAGASTYTDTSISSLHTYQYRIRAIKYDGYSDWCYSSVLNLGVGSFKFEGVRMEGVKID